MPAAASAQSQAPLVGRRPSDVIREANRKATEGPSTEAFFNAIMTYDYSPGAPLPNLHRAAAADRHPAPARASASSASRRPATTSAGFSRAGARRPAGTEQQHIYIKPTRPDLDTTLAINTDRRSYILELHSYDDTYMAAVAWRYPQDEIAQLETTLVQQQELAQTTTASNVSIDKLNFGYGLVVMSGTPSMVADPGLRRRPQDVRPISRRDARSRGARPVRDLERRRDPARELPGQERHVHRRPPLRRGGAAPRAAEPGNRPHRPHALVAAKEPPMHDDTTKRDLNPPSFGVQASPALPTSPADAATSTASGMTFASKLPADHPGLRLQKAQSRTLKKGPIVTAGAILGVTVGIALIVAFSPRGEHRNEAAPTLTEAPAKNVQIAEAVENAPGNDGDLHAPPRLGPPLGGSRHPAGSGAGQSAAYADGSRGPVGGGAREERAKALHSAILVDLENPVQAEQPSSAMAPPASGGGTSPISGQPVAPALAPPSLSGANADPNLQQHKSDFLSRDGASNANYLSQPLLTPRSPYEVKAGTIVPATLITGLNSDLPGEIIGQVRENVYDTVAGIYLLIPQGSRLIATYDSAVAFGQERLLVCWNRLIRPDGVSIALECMPGVDLAGYAGFSDDVDHHWWRIITGVALGTLLSATAQRSQGDVSGFTPTVPQLWASNVGASLNQAGQQITQRNLAIQPTIKVRPGYTVNVLVTKDIVLVPYSQQQGGTP